MRRVTKKLLGFLLAGSVVFGMSGMTVLATEENDTSFGAAYAEEVMENVGIVEESVDTDTAENGEEIMEETEPSAMETAGSIAETESKTESDVGGLTDPSEKTETFDAQENSLVYQTLNVSVQPGDARTSTMPDAGQIILSGVMPEGAYAAAAAVDVEIEGVAVLAAYDITIWDASGEEYQPKDGAIRVHIANQAIRNAEREDRYLFIYHMKNKYADPEKVPVKEAADGSVEFDAESFSIYIVGTDLAFYELDEETPHYVYKVNFYLGDTADRTLLSSQTVSPGEKVDRPAVPDREHYEFAGWFTEPDGGGDRYDFYSGVMSEITDGQDHEIDLYAHYIKLYYVHYMTHEHEEGDECTRVNFYSESYSPGQPLDTAEAEALYLAEGYLSYIDEQTGALITALAVTGWLDEDGTPWKSGDPIDWDVIDGNLILYPVVEAAYWVYYDMNGHDSVENPAPEYLLASEENIGELPAPEVSGYSFDGWYTEAEDGDLVTADTALASLPKNTDGSITLYAHWSLAKVAYTINIWRQKAIDGAKGIDSKEIADSEVYDDYIQYYDFAESHYVTAQQSELYTGDTPTQEKVYNWAVYTGYATTTNSDSAYYGFEYEPEHTSGSWLNPQIIPETTSVTRTRNDLAAKTMEADGSTVINIFYNRVTVTWTFQANGSYGVSGTLIGLYDTNVCQGSDNAAGTLPDWPDPGKNRVWISSTTGDITTFKARFDLEKNKASSTFSNAGFNAGHYLYYYLEVTNEALQVDETGAKAQEAADNGVAYTRTVNGTLYVYNQSVGITSGNTFYFTDKYAGYYLVGYIDSANGAAQTTYTQASSSTTLTSGHSFWYDGYIFNNANDKNTITLISSDRVVGVDAAGDAVDTAEGITYPNKTHSSVKYGTDISAYPFPDTLDSETWGPAYYYHFVGWYEDPTFTAPFTETTIPKHNLVAYAKWELNDITVSFDTGRSEVTPPDAQKITATEKASDPGTLEREGYTHVGWVDQNGKLFNFDTVLYADTALTAIWKADDESGCLIQYDLNTGSSYGLLDAYKGDTAVTTTEHFTVDEELWTIEQAFPDLGKEEANMFIGWNTLADGTGTMYYPDDILTLGDSVLVNEDVVTLYAIWAHRNESALVLVHNYPGGYVLGDGETKEDWVTGDNLSAVDVESTSGLEYHHEIEVTDGTGTVHTYRFDGWSTSNPGKDPSDKDVDIAADAVVAADTLYTSAETRANYLYAVWLEVHGITVTKEIVNNAVNYTVPEDQMFDFSWSYVDGEGETIRSEEEISIQNGESFIIPDVATGESVRITETAADGFTTSYTGAHDNVYDDGNGSYTFDMEENSVNIIVYNTVDHTTKVTVTKVWSDDDIDHSNDAVAAIVRENGEQIGGEITLSGKNDWTGSVEIIMDEENEYTVEESQVPNGYRADVTGDVDGGFTITNTWTGETDPEEEEPVPGDEGGSGPEDPGQGPSDTGTETDTTAKDDEISGTVTYIKGNETAAVTGTNTSDSKDGNVKKVKTSDPNTWMLYLSLILISGAAAVIVSARRTRIKKSSENR